jgi:hypothetical protein
LPKISGFEPEPETAPYARGLSWKWRPDLPRYRRVARFVELLFGRIDKLRAAGFDPKWKDVNLSTQVPGLERLQAAQEWLDRSAPKSQSARP